MIEGPRRDLPDKEYLQKEFTRLRTASTQIWEDAERLLDRLESKGKKEENIEVSSIKVAESKDRFFIEKARKMVVNEYVERFGIRDETTKELLITSKNVYEKMYTQEYPSTEFLGFVRVKDVIGVKLGSTMRLLHGKQEAYPIDAAHNFTHPDGWENISSGKIGELSRLAYANFKQIKPDLGKREVRKIKSHLLKEMTEKAAQTAKSLGIETVYAVMHDVVRGFFEYEGMPPTLVEGAKLIENEETGKLFDQFPLYWRVSPPPRLYRWNVEDLLTN